MKSRSYQLALSALSICVILLASASHLHAQSVGGTYGWSAPQALSTGAPCHYHQIADLNADGKVDIVVPTRSTNTVHVFLNLGGGVFAPDLPVATLTDPISIEVTDLNRDGKMDLVVAGFGSDSLRVHWGNGLGGFSTGPTYAQIGHAHGIAIADFNLDGWPDLAVTTAESTDGVRILINDGAGGLITGSFLPTDGNPYFVATIDLDNDGDQDVTVGSFLTSRLALWRNNQGSGFSGILNPVQLQGVNPGRISFADFDNDGLVEFVTPYRGTPAVSHYESTGFSSFNFIGNISVPTAGGFTGWWSEAADIDLDGNLDVAFGGTGSGSVGITLQTAPGVFGSLQDLSIGSNVNCIRIADMNGDGSPDITTAAHDSNAVMIAYSTLFLDCNSNGIPDSLDLASASSADCDGNNIPDECDLGSPSRDCNSNGLLDTCEIAVSPSLDLNSNGLLDQCEQAGTPYCFGDGSGAVCPCDPGQVGQAGRGCANSTGNGGKLSAVGNPQVSLDSITMTGTGMDSSAISMLFQGTLAQAGGQGSAFGDGLLCANGTITRLIIRAATAGTVSYGRSVPGDQAISGLGMIPGAGATRFYQLWYRDSQQSFCTPSTYNLSNGLRIDWVQ